MATADEYKIKIVTETDASGADAQAKSLAAIAEAAKAVEAASVQSAKVAEAVQKQAAQAVAEAAEETARRQIEASEKAAAAAKRAAEVQRAAASEARSLDGMERDGANQSQAGAWAEEAQRVFGDFGAQAAEATSAAGEFGQEMMDMGKNALAVVGGFAAVQQAVMVSLDEFAAGELAVQQLDAALDRAGLSTDAYRAKLEELASTLSSEVTNVGGDQWLAVLTQLTQAGADNSDIDELAEGVKNLAGIMGGNVEAASAVFSRALRGNFEMLRRYGFEVDEGASHTEKMVALFEVASQGAGQMEARAGTLTGQTEILGNAWGDLKKAFGTLIAPAAMGALSIMTSAVNMLASIIPGATKAVGEMEDAQNKLRASTDATTESILTQGATFGSIGNQTAARSALFDRQRKAAAEGRQRADELTDARLAKDEATVESAEAQGKVTPEKAAIARENLRTRAEKEKLERGQQGRAEEIKSREAETALLYQSSVSANEKAKRSKLPGDQADADEVSDQYVTRARENAEAIERLRTEMEQERELSGLRNQTRRTQTVGNVLGMRRTEQERKAKEAEKKTGKAGESQADVDREARGIGADAGALKGPSPEVTRRLQSAAAALSDGADGGELDALNGVLDKLASALEKKGKGGEAKGLRELQGRISKLEGVVRRLESQQGGSGS